MIYILIYNPENIFFSFNLEFSFFLMDPKDIALKWNTRYVYWSLPLDE